MHKSEFVFWFSCAMHAPLTHITWGGIKRRESIESRTCHAGLIFHFLAWQIKVRWNQLKFFFEFLVGRKVHAPFYIWLSFFRKYIKQTDMHNLVFALYIFRISTCPAELWLLLLTIFTWHLVVHFLFVLLKINFLILDDFSVLWPIRSRYCWVIAIVCGWMHSSSCSGPLKTDARCARAFSI